MGKLAEITIISDASHCSQSKAGGWAFWAKSSGWEKAIWHSGAFKTPMRDSTDSELGGIANAFHCLHALDLLTPTTVYVQCDSLIALALLIKYCKARAMEASDHPIPTLKSDTFYAGPIKEMLDVISDLQEAVAFRLFVKHVKGHHRAGSQGRTPTNGRYRVNTILDGMAKKEMRKRRKKIAKALKN